MKKLRVFFIALIVLLAMIPTEALFAQSAQNTDSGSEWNIKIEFRYTKGEESKLNIPGTIAKYGRTYHLVSRTDPILEKTLPASREYVWQIDGTITESERQLLEGTEGVKLTPTTIKIGRVIDKHETMEGLQTNDVEAIPLKRTYSEGDFYRAAVRFDATSYDEFGLPVSFTAEVVYRGYEIFNGPGYNVSVTYTKEEELDGVPQYVVVATYAPDDLVPVSAAGSGGTDGRDQAGSGGAAFEPAVIVNSNAAAIPNESLPQASGDKNKPGAINSVALILLIIALLFGGFVVWALITRQKNKKEKARQREKRRSA